MKRLGFTLAEVLLVLVIIGVIAAMVTPAFLSSTGSQEYKAGLKKAISALNQAMNMQYFVGGTKLSDYFGGTYTPIIVRDQVFAQRMNIFKTDNVATTYGGDSANSSTANFYTADGMKFGLVPLSSLPGAPTGTCDSEGLSPCYGVFIDLNGDKNPNKATVSSSDPGDVYIAILYSQRVLPYQTATQEVMYDR